MRIKDVHLSKDDKFITLSAVCHIRKRGEDTVYFRFNKEEEDFVVADASPFAAALLIPSMKQGEDLIIQGAISEALYHGMQHIMKIMLDWNIGLHPITIKVDTLVKDVQNPAITASFFSGGVDSFYTYLKHKRDISDRITHFLLVAGYDIDPRNTHLWQSTLANVEQIAHSEGIQLITTKSNIRWILEPMLGWNYAHGGCLAAIALCLREKLRMVYIPSAVSLEQLTPWGTHPAIDYLWGTEKLTFVHDGNEATRLERIQREIAKSPVALTYLRVCYMNVRDIYNCCRCEKCLRTMLMLKIAGVLDQAKTFTLPINEGILSKLSLEVNTQTVFYEEILAEFKRLQIEPVLQKIVENRLKNSVVTHSSLLSLFRQRVIYLDHIYNHGRVYKVMSKVLGKKF